MYRIIATLALTVPALAMAQVTSNANSLAQTASTSGSVASPNQSLNLNSYAPDHQSEKVYSNPTVYAPGMSSGFSPMNCANSVSGGASGALIGLSLGGPKESLWCNGRADATILMQMANAVYPHDKATATALTDAATRRMCKQSDDTASAMRGAGLCPGIAPNAGPAYPSMDGLYAQGNR